MRLLPLLAFGLVVAGCSSGSDQAATPSTPAATSASATPPEGGMTGTPATPPVTSGDKPPADLGPNPGKADPSKP